MPRMARVVSVGVPHHITQRGNQRRDVFLNDGLRRVYLDAIGQWGSNGDVFCAGDGMAEFRGATAAEQQNPSRAV